MYVNLSFDNPTEPTGRRSFPIQEYLRDKEPSLSHTLLPSRPTITVIRGTVIKDQVRKLY